MTLDNILEKIKKAESIVVLTHENPDGDAIGSMTAVYGMLKQMGKNVDMIMPEYARIFEFLPYVDEIKKEGKETYDLAIAVDTATIKMLNGYAYYFENAKSTIVIDHHGTNGMFGDLNYVDPNAPACAQVLIPILDYFGIEIDKNIAICLITGIITDTGGFQYSSVTAETFEFASEVLQKGVNIPEIYKQVMETKTKGNFELTRKAMDRMEFFEDDKIAFTYITMEDQENVNAENGDHEGIVNIGRSIEGVEVSVFARETEKGFKISLRSNSYVNVSDICLVFGGGGHIRAAGCLIQATIEQVKVKLISQIKSQLK